MSATEYILRSYPFVLFLSQLLKLSNLVIPTLGYQILQLPLQILHSPLSILNYNWLREWIQITTKWFEHRRAKFRFDYSDVRCLQIWFSNLLYIQKVWKWSLMSFAKEFAKKSGIVISCKCHHVGEIAKFNLKWQHLSGVATVGWFHEGSILYLQSYIHILLSYLIVS